MDKIKICTTCGAQMLLSKAVDGVIKCDYCKTMHTIAKESASPAALNFLSAGEHDLDTGKFDDAYEAYKKAAELDSSEPEAYFGMALAEFCVQYIKDIVNNCLQPVCHEITDKNFCDNKNYKRANQLATPAQRVEYEKKAKDIDYIRAEFFKLKNSGLEYDCFICVKVTEILDGKKRRTMDYEDADEIYTTLKEDGYKPFFSEKELKNVSGVDYEARILYALYSAKCMLVVCENEEFLRTPWVKNEYTRFLKLVNDEEKESDSVTIVYRGKPIEKLPGKNGKIQGIDSGSLNALHRIESFVERHVHPQKATAATDELEQIRLEREKLERDRAEFARLQKEQAEKERAQVAVNLDDFEIVGGELKRYKGKGGDVIIPDSVTAIGKEAFYLNGELTSIIIPNKATSIGEYAFNCCYRLISITIGNSVTSIGIMAFHSCSSLTNITIPNSVTYIGDYAFNSCSKLASITMSNSITYIGYRAFSDCYRLTSITIPNKVTSIGGMAFSGCSSLTSIEIPDSVTTVGENAFKGCNSLTSVTIPKKFKSELKKIFGEELAQSSKCEFIFT